MEHLTSPATEKVLEAAREFLRGLCSAENIMIAVSGGSDSSGLLLAFHQAVSEPEFSHHRICAVTVDHALRPESALEASSVGQWCRQIGVCHVTKVWGAPKPKSGISLAARQARYKLLVEAADDLGASLILLGHNLGDQKETIAMRQQRNGDPSLIGSAGMADAVLIYRKIWACRPFLSLTRQDIRDYLLSIGRMWFDDPSNDNLAYERVRVRKELSIEDVAFDECAGERREDLARRAAIWFNSAVCVYPTQLVEIDRQLVAQDPEAARYAISFLAAIVGGRAFSLPKLQLETVWQLLTGQDVTRYNAHRVVFDIRKNRLFLCREKRLLPPVPTDVLKPTIWDDRFWLLPDQQGKEMISPTIPLNAVQRYALERSPYGSSIAFQGRIEVALRPFDEFLPRFDLAFVQAVNSAFAREPLKPLPFDQNRA